MGHHQTVKDLLIKSILSFPRRREFMRNKVLDPRLRGDEELISSSLSRLLGAWFYCRVIEPLKHFKIASSIARQFRRFS